MQSLSGTPIEITNMASHLDQRLVLLLQALHPHVLLSGSSANLEQRNAAQGFPGAIVHHCVLILAKNKENPGENKTLTRLWWAKETNVTAEQGGCRHGRCQEYFGGVGKKSLIGSLIFLG